MVLLSNGGGALPTGLSATTPYFVKTIDVNTFYLYTDSAFQNITAFSTNGTGTNSYNLQCRMMKVSEFKIVNISMYTANNANFTVKLQGTNEYDAANFNFFKAQSATNRWSYLQMVETDGGSKINGSTGTGPSGTDTFTMYEANINSVNWICLQFATVTAGSVEITATCYQG